MNEFRKRKPIQWLTLTSVLMAANIILSMSIFSVPVPGGHFYLCDAVIDLAALILDPLGAFCVGGIGSFLGDMLFYPAPMFVSLVTHGLQAIIISIVSRKLFANRERLSGIIALIIGALVMVLGYTLGRAYVYSTPEYAILKLPFEFLQAGVGVVAAFFLRYVSPLKKVIEQRIHGRQ